MRFARFNKEPVGNGLFRFVRWQKGQQVVVEANPDAWAGGRRWTASSCATFPSPPAASRRC
jgi:ABC-type transport system substrate-binding protein